MRRQILKYPDPRLARKAEPISELTPELKTLAQDMVETMYASEGIGLAANQVGECCRMVVVDVSGPKERTDLHILVNPRIVAHEGAVTSEEGCLSVRDYRADVTRHEKITVEAQDLDGAPLHVEADGLLAVCLQHELDHLEGKLFIDRISRLKRTFYDQRVRKWAREAAARAAERLARQEAAKKAEAAGTAGADNPLSDGQPSAKA